MSWKNGVIFRFRGTDHVFRGEVGFIGVLGMNGYLVYELRLVHKLTQQTWRVAQQIVKLAQQTSKVAQQTRKLAQQTSKLAQQALKVSQLIENQIPNYMKKAQIHNGFEPSHYFIEKSSLHAPKSQHHHNT
ncbi:hypothetical protein [uncultured Rossellomorea sp.]|uniref:hypothetical protein n=1 Tax=uncultured Rossellomorea sp. TaxID=2837549 RepID=UPI00261A5508|nr:hypothetical protein [uncultured Rossellomorea sp.]